MQTVLPHVAQAVDSSRRLTAQVRALTTLHEAADWLADGVALLNAAGRPLFVNASLSRIAAVDDGLLLTSDGVEFAAAEARLSFRLAMSALHRMQAGELRDPARDFLAKRPSGRRAYQVSLRPLSNGGGDGSEATFLLLVSDPSAGAKPAAEALQHRFGLTPAEADLGLALSQGESLRAYAHRRQVSPNTVYTHLRRMKEKCDCRGAIELIALLNTVRGGPAADG